MKKILKHLFVCLVMFIVIGNVNAAEYTCKYKGDGQWLTFVVKNGNVDRDDVTSGGSGWDDLDGGAEEIVNWSSDFGGFSATSYANEGVCPPFALTFNENFGMDWHYYVSNEDNIANIKKEFKKKYDGYDIYYKLGLTEGPKQKLEYNTELTFYYFINNEHASNINESTKQEIKYSDVLNNATSNSNTFQVDGFVFDGWNVAIKDSQGNLKYATNNNNDLNRLVKNGEKLINITTLFEFKEDFNNEIYLYAQWKVKGDLTPIEIKEYGLGKSECERREFMWVGSEEDGYCNIDNLQFVYCGDAKDIPSYVPRIVSLIVNLLKIATPIILIFVSIISLLKAVASTNEDEIKKAQKGLTRKIIAAVLVFFVIQIVQFVIKKVADTTTPSKINNQTEEKNVSSCLSCFLNNDCSGSTYYRYYLYGEYHYYRVEDSQEITLFNE